MFNVGGGEIKVVLLLALLVLGPDKLPEYMRKLGRHMAELRRMTSGFQEEFRSAMDLGGQDPAPASGDALSRTSEGPRLMPAPPPVSAPMTPRGESASPDDTPDGRPAPAPGPAAAAPPAPIGPELVAPAQDGPELITPGRPSPAPEVAPVDPEGDHGSTSAA